MEISAPRQLVLKKLREEFPDPQIGKEALTLLDTYGTESWHREKDRVHLALLKLSAGSLEELRRSVESAKSDFRNVLVGAEYPEEFVASSKTSPQEMKAIRARDRAQYEVWMNSHGSTSGRSEDV
jgi:hypothetical protein